MTPPSEPAGGDAGETARRMRAIAAGLTAAPLDTHVPDPPGVLDVTASLHRPGHKQTEVILDDDGYIEIRYWNHPGATPGQVTAVITRALTAIADAQRT